MKGYFGVFHDQIFHLLDKQDIQTTVADIGTGMVSERTNELLRVSLNISNVSENASTNRETFLDAVKTLEEKNSIAISQLQPTYRMSVDYTLTDINSGTVLDSAILTKTIEPKNAALCLGLCPSNNELVYRVAKLFNHAVELTYKEKLPYGIMQPKRRDRLMLTINNVRIEQLRISEPVDHGRYDPHYHRHDECDPRYDHICLYGFHTPPCPPPPVMESRRHPAVRPEYVFSGNPYEVLYDSGREGIVFNDLEIPFRPRKILVDIRVLLNNYFFTSDEEDIFSVVRKNQVNTFPPAEGLAPPPNRPHPGHNHHHHCPPHKEENSRPYVLPNGSFDITILEGPTKPKNIEETNDEV